MRVLEEPFMTREAILAVLGPGRPASEARFRTLRHNHYASRGLRADLRSPLGRVLGQAHFYSSLNADAARAARFGERRLAQGLADQAQEIERSHQAEVLREAVEVCGSRLGADPDPPVSLQRYLRARARASWRGLDQHAMTREWLIHSGAWLSEDEHGDLAEAIVELARRMSETRARLHCDALPPVSTFFGIVRRMDAVAAEVQGEAETRLLPREDLDRQGLAMVGQAVTLLCESLPAGGSLVLALPAVVLEAPEPSIARSPWDLPDGDGAMAVSTPIDAADQAWLTHGLAREPTAVPLAPIQKA
ncbi:MAG TPA: hypothetical protein VNX67_00320 [Solirubrobacteraceae bacterium]|nr:hypothetical protein [Solirubrobacteraceae bacterium]